MTMLEEKYMHPAVWGVYQFFSYEHLPGNLQEISKPFCLLANDIINKAPNGGAELTVCLRKLLEAKDCAVRAWINHARIGKEAESLKQNE